MVISDSSVPLLLHTPVICFLFVFFAQSHPFRICGTLSLQTFIFYLPLSLMFVRNPTEFTKAQLGESSARSRMAFRMDRSAADIHAYLASLER